VVGEMMKIKYSAFLTQIISWFENDIQSFFLSIMCKFHSFKMWRWIFLNVNDWDNFKSICQFIAAKKKLSSAKGAF
jgi:hypothetical protein